MHLIEKGGGEIQAGLTRKTWRSTSGLSTHLQDVNAIKPYVLVYGVELVLPLEVQIPSLCIATLEGLSEDDNHKLHPAELESLDEKMLQAQQKLECYQTRLSRSFNKKVHPRPFQVGDQVPVVRRLISMTHKIGNNFP